MLVIFLRTLILYLTLVFGIRLMGKRQLGELQPSDLVVAILISNIATLPIEESEIPMFAGLLPILSLISFEVVASYLCLKSRKIRRFVSGRPIVIIQNGKINQKEMKELRFSADDLMSQLRQNGIFKVSDVDFAVVETTGKLSLYEKFLARTPSAEELSLPDDPTKNSPALTVISEGEILDDNLTALGRDTRWLQKEAARHHVLMRDIFLMTVDSDGSTEIIKKEEES